MVLLTKLGACAPIMDEMNGASGNPVLIPVILMFLIASRGKKFYHSLISGFKHPGTRLGGVMPG